MPNLVKFISTLLQKFHQNSGSLFEQGEATPPKISSRKNHQRPISFGRTPCGHCYCSMFRNSVSVSSSVSTVSVTRPQCPWHVPRRLFPNLLVALRGLLRASARMRHRRRGAARTESALCRRRARATPFRRARPKRPNPGQLSTKMDPLNLRDDARLPNHPDRALRHRNRSPEISVHGNRLGPPIKRAPSSPSCTPHPHSSPTPRQATRGTSRRSPPPAPAAPIRLGLQLDSLR